MRKVRNHGMHTLSRVASEQMQLHIPRTKVQAFCQKREYGDYDATQAKHRPWLLPRSDVEIVLAYNAELRGFANYYSLGLSAKRRLDKLMFLGKMSLMKTLANKHKTSVSKIYRRLRKGRDLVLTYEGKGKPKSLKVFTLRDHEKPQVTWGTVDSLPQIYKYTSSRTELTRRLGAEVCEYCGQTKGYFEVHHVRKLSDIKAGKEAWQKLMIAMQRKTLILCVECHDLLTAGKLPIWRRNMVKEESRMN
jgi:RNA-directed DNA polymerase